MPVPAARPHRFVGKHAEVPGVTTFRFDVGDPTYEWQAGQNLVLTIPGVEDPRGDTRPFTVSSSPTEKGFLAMTTKAGESPFKKRLSELAPGTEVMIGGPEGEFVLVPGRPAIFVAGGIGITPFRSMLRFATDTRLEKPLILVYSSATPESIVFRRELEELARRNPALRFEMTVTKPGDSKESWTGRTGRIDAELLRHALRGVRHPLVYLAGPPSMVRDHRTILEQELHLAGEDVRTDEFDGY
jgi:ferredoxin-NADP reductase